MDKQRKSSTFKRWHYVLIGLLILAPSLIYFLSKEETLRIDNESITIQRVTNDQFNEYINLTGQVIPEMTYYIDSKVAGNVERIYVESGQRVERGDTLLFISNADLELDVMQRESQLIEQLNAQRQTRLLINQNDFTRREQLLDVGYQLRLLDKQLNRGELLLADSVISNSEYEPTENNFVYYTKRAELLKEAYRTDSLARVIQLNQINDAEQRLSENLRRVRSILDRRYVLAATDGRLSDFSVRTGQAITMGQRIGEIYLLEQPVLLAEADEFYLERIYPDQPGQVLIGQDTISLTVKKIYPTVENGRFRIEVAVTEKSAATENWTKGQSRRIRLLFGKSSPSVLLASGNFYASTGGFWVYRLTTENTAIRTPIRLGRANPDYYEVLEGLVPGDRVITSTYDDFKEYQTITIN